MDKKELQKIEDDHMHKLRELELLEFDLDYYYYKFDRETENIIEAVSYACRGEYSAEIQSHIFEIEDNLDNYRQLYNARIDDILDLRSKENKTFYRKLEENKI
jgi:hypothetical protein